MSNSNVLIYYMRRDLRVSDNPVLHRLVKETDKHGFTHLLPLYVFDARQIEVSGLIPQGRRAENPFPKALTPLRGYWRCGPHRAKFIAESVQNLQNSLEALGSGLGVRVGMPVEVIKCIIDGFEKQGCRVGAVWTVHEEGQEDHQDEISLRNLCQNENISFDLMADEKYFIDDRDLSIQNIEDLPNVFTDYRKDNEPLRERPRKPLPKPSPSSLPPFIAPPAQAFPFVIPDNHASLLSGLLAPLRDIVPELVARYKAMDANKPREVKRPDLWPNCHSGHPFKGGEDEGHQRLRDLFSVENATLIHKYADTRNQLLGTGYSTKLSAYLAQGCLTARQVHQMLVDYEQGTDDTLASALGYGSGENKGSHSLRMELLWRDYMHLCSRRFRSHLRSPQGFKRVMNKAQDGRDMSVQPGESETTAAAAAVHDVATILYRFETGTTGLGLIDASQRELIHTGYTSGRARQNVSFFLSRRLMVDWRYGAEWYEMMLVDYDECSNWGNWQYMAGVGNDPRGDQRQYNVVKQALDYDPTGAFVRTWVPEVAALTELEHVFQVVTAPDEVLEQAHLLFHPMAAHPVKRIEFKNFASQKTKAGPRDQTHDPGGSGHDEAGVSSTVIPARKNRGMARGHRPRGQTRQRSHPGPSYAAQNYVGQSSPEQSSPEQSSSGQSYPGQNYSPQGYSPQSYPPQGYPPQGYPPQGYPPQGYPPQGYPPQGYPPQGYPPQSYTEQGYSSQGHPPQGYPAQGYSSQGYPAQGYPPQGYPPQSYPVQSYLLPNYPDQSSGQAYQAFSWPADPRLGYQGAVYQGTYMGQGYAGETYGVQGANCVY